MSDEYKITPKTVFFDPVYQKFFDLPYQKAEGEYQRVLHAEEPCCKECFCPKCNGVKGVDCRYCNSTGKLESYHPNPHLRDHAFEEHVCHRRKCPQCKQWIYVREGAFPALDGSGEVPLLHYTCDSCQYLEHYRPRVKITIP